MAGPAGTALPSRTTGRALLFPVRFPTRPPLADGALCPRPQALQSIGNSGNGQLGPDQLNNLAALLAMEGVTAEAIMALLPQQGGLGAPFGGLPAEALLAGAGGGLLPPQGLQAPLYGGYGQQAMAPPPAPYGQPGRYGAPPPHVGFGGPAGMPLDMQLQQALLAQQRMAAMQQAPPPPVSAALLQQYAGASVQFPPAPPQYSPLPQLFAGGSVSPPPSGWAPQQAPRMAPAALSAPPSLRPGSHSSGSGSPLEASAPQMSLDEALAALSKLKAAQQAPLGERGGPRARRGSGSAAARAPACCGKAAKPQPCVLACLPAGCPPVPPCTAEA